MKEVFRISIADSVVLMNKLDKFNIESWSEDYSDEIFDKLYDNGYDLSESVDFDVSDDKVVFYFLTNEYKKVYEQVSNRICPMRVNEFFIGSTDFCNGVDKSGYGELFKLNESLEIVNVTHDDIDNSVVYDLRKLTTEGGKHDTFVFTDEYLVECIKNNDDEDYRSRFPRLGEGELSGESAIEL